MKIFNPRTAFHNSKPQFNIGKRSRGITLFELGIVLLIIAVAMAGTYIAYDFFIKRVKSTKTMIEMQDYRKGFESFHSVYGAIPGDMTSASRRIASTMIDGNGDGKVASESEQNAFWPHMGYSKIIAKKYENVANNVSPKIAYNLPRLQDSDDIAIGVIYNTPSGVRANSYILGGLDGRSVTVPRFSVEDAQVMDQKFDDNNPITGGVMCGMGVQSGTITACNYSSPTTQSDANIFIPFTPQTTDASNSCPAQSVQISQQLVANAPAIAANAIVSYNCRDINPSYSGAYSLTCIPVRNSSNAITGYSVRTTATTCSLKTCAVPTLASISGASSIQSAAVQSGQYLSYTCNAGLYATKSLCSPNLSTDTASFNPAPACTSTPTGISGNIPIYAIDTQTFQDSGRKFNDSGSTVYDIFSGSKIFGLFGSTTTSQNYIPKYNTQNTGVVPSSIYDNGTSVGIGTATPNSSAILDLTSTTKAFLPPRMTTAQMNAIATPTKGMLIFNMTDGVFYQYNGTGWESLQKSVPVAGATPVGTIAAWSSTTAPNGWVLVDGTTVTSSSNYPELCKVLNNGTACASGTTKTVPDFRGYFLRGYGTNPDGTTSGTGVLLAKVSGASNGTTVANVNSLAVNTSQTQTTPAQLQSYYDSVSGPNAPDTVPAEVTAASNGVPGYSVYLGHNVWWYRGNGVGSWTSFGGKISFNLPITKLYTSKTTGFVVNNAIAVNYIMKAESTTLTSQDIDAVLSKVMGFIGGTPTANSFAMFDSTASKFVSTNVYQKTAGSTTSVGVGTSSPTPSAVLELSSTTQGFLPPRMTIAQMNAIVAPVLGMIVYTTDNGTLQIYNGTNWAILTPPSTGPTATTVPAGTIVAWSSNTIPSGWLLLNGANYDSATYPDLANARGCTTASCPLPDFRGYFIRGLGGVDSDAARTIGSIQLDSTALPKAGFSTSAAGGHSHTIPLYNYAIGTGQYVESADSNYRGNDTSTSAAPDHYHYITGGDAETRPKNIAVNYIIKAKNVMITQSDLASMMSSIMTTGTTGTPNSISMFDSTGAKFQSSGLSQVANVLNYNPTGTANLMSLAQTGMSLTPKSGMALKFGNDYTGIGNPNYTGVNGLSDKLQFYVNSTTTPSLTVNANGVNVTGAFTVNGSAISGGSGSGVPISATAPASPTAGTIYYDTTTNQLRIYSTDGVNPNWFRVLTRKDVIAFTITAANGGFFDPCSGTPNAIVPSNVASIVGGSSGLCDYATGYQWVSITIPFPIPNAVVTATWGVHALAYSGSLFQANPGSLVISHIVTNSTQTNFGLFFNEPTGAPIQQTKINVTVINPN